MSAVVLITFHAGYSHSSLALAALQAACAEEPFFPQIHRLEPLEKADPRWVLEQVLARRPAVAGFSAYLWNIERCLHLARLIKQLSPQTLIVFGGPEAGPRARELLETEAALDFVIEGEGEEAFRDLLRWRLSGVGGPEGVSGLWRRDGARIRSNPPRPPDLAALPSPFELGLIAFDRPLIYWETSRGCPFKCTFCSSAEERLRLIPLPRLERELAVIGRHKDKTVKLLDRSFHLGKGRTLGLLQRFADSGDSLRFHLELNPDRISEEAMRLFEQAAPGRFQFEIGLQTLDAGVLARIQRAMDAPLALQNIRRLTRMRRHALHLDLIVGLPGEGARQCAAALDRTFKLYPDHLQLGFLKLLPGTPLQRQATTLGYLWDRQPPYEVLQTPHLSFAEISRLKRYAELLERLWNSGLLRHTLMRLTDAHWGGALSQTFELMLHHLPDGMLRARPGPPVWLEALGGLLQPRLAADAVLRQLFLWDYCSQGVPGGRTPEWIRGLLPPPQRVKTPAGRKPLHRLQLDAVAAAIVNEWRRDPLPAGAYFLWPQRHLKGVPLEILPADGATTTAGPSDEA